jgi:16S rRNA (cytosine1402-N4)-methyltransferase
VGSFHRAVLVDAVCDALTPALSAGAGPARWYVDLTAGGGGHASAMARSGDPTGIVLVDRDPTALHVAAARLAHVAPAVWLIHGAFSGMGERVPTPAAMLADLGVSSHHFDEPSRGFSFRAPAPLDMRMDPTRGDTAADLVREADADTLARWIFEFGEEPMARRIARAIADARPQTTDALATLVESVVPRRRTKPGIHPATRTFQALRIVVNDELGELDALLQWGPERLAIGGRLAIITFHSLEDRRVKRRFRALSRAPQLPKGLPIPESERPRPRFRVPKGWKDGRVAADEETRDNPRARSARVRLIERIAA